MAVTTPRVWKAHLDQPGDPFSRLSADERARATRYASPDEGRRFAVARAVLRSILGEVCGTPAGELVFGKSEAGRPVLVGAAAPDFNLSHSGEWALIAIAPPGRRVGVDVERISRKVDWLGMAHSMYHRDEVDRMLSLPLARQRAEFFRLWTLKEAYAKADGVGIAGLRDVVVDGTTARSLSRPTVLATRWFEVAAGYPAALAYSGDGEFGSGEPVEWFLER